MKNIFFVITSFFIISLYSCDIDKTKSGEMPSVDIDVDTKSGELPEFDVDWVNIDVGTTTKTVTVPTVEIVMEEREVEVPLINAKWPSEYDDVQEQTIAVEAEVTGYEHGLEINEIYAIGEKLIVVSSLDKKNTKIGDKVMRVNDQVVINAPDLTVKHYIVGNKPGRGFNNNYTYISNRNKILKRLKGAKKIYG